MSFLRASQHEQHFSPEFSERVLARLSILQRAQMNADQAGGARGLSVEHQARGHSDAITELRELREAEAADVESTLHAQQARNAVQEAHNASRGDYGLTA